MSKAKQKIVKMKLWKTEQDIQPLEGGITNQNFLVTDQGQKYFVRVGEDIPEHGVMRFNELAASRAAFAAGISPEVIHAEAGIMVLQYIDAKPLTADDIQQADKLPEIIQLIHRCHQRMPHTLRGPALVFWVFQVLRDYSQTLNANKSPWLVNLRVLMPLAEQLEKDVGDIQLVFGHNDLLAANFMDDGERLWLIDWDYAGFNSPLFDLGGLASNNDFSTELEMEMFQLYYSKTPDAALLKKYSAMKCASLLRETMWSMVSEIHSNIEFDFHSYTKNNLLQFQQAMQQHQKQYHA